MGPACRSDHKEDNHLAANVTGNEAGQKKQANKHARKQTCQNRQEKQTGISFQNRTETQLGKNGGKRNMNLNQSDVVSLCHACHAKRRWMWVRATPVPRLPRKTKVCHKCHACHAKRRWMWVCATPATWNEGGCHQVPRLPHKGQRRHRRQIRTKRAT